jgi:hypothetical protein
MAIAVRWSVTGKRASSPSSAGSRVDRSSKVPAQHPTEPFAVLHEDRLVQAELLPHGLVHHLVAHVRFADVGQRGIARQEQRDGERDHRDEEQHRHEVDDPPQDALPHAPLRLW